MKCSMCGSTSVTQHVETEKIAYKKSFLQVPMHYSLCADCGHEFVPAVQIKINDKAVFAAKRTADGLLSPEEIYSIREALGLTQAQAAEAFGGGRNAFSKYERGEVAQSEPMDKLLRLVSRMPGLLQELIGAAQGVSEASSNVVYVNNWHTEDTVETFDLSYKESAVVSSVVLDQEQQYG